jgi:hypothetical protein
VLRELHRGLLKDCVRHDQLGVNSLRNDLSLILMQEQITAPPDVTDVCIDQAIAV